jgi:predicted transcriptional regulator
MLNGGGEKLAQLMQQKGYRLVVIDTLSRAIPGDQQDVQAMTRALTPLQEMAHQVNCALMINDHHRKAGAINSDVIADILGSTAKGAMADTVWSLYRERGKKGAKLAITGRDVEEQTLQLEFDANSCNWSNLGNAATLDITQRRQEILDALSRLGRSSSKEIAEEIGQPNSHTHNRLQDLAAAGLVVRTKDGRNVFYELAELPVIDVKTCNDEQEQ